MGLCNRQYAEQAFLSLTEEEKNTVVLCGENGVFCLFPVASHQWCDDIMDLARLYEERKNSVVED